jgi:hypothetical protein
MADIICKTNCNEATNVHIYFPSMPEKGGFILGEKLRWTSGVVVCGEMGRGGRCCCTTSCVCVLSFFEAI